MWIYPVKGCRGVEVSEAVVEQWGLRGDRRWMVVDAEGRFRSQRQSGALARVTAALTEDGITLSADGLENLAVKEPVGGELTPVTVWGSSLEAVLSDGEAAAWFSELLGAPVRLVWLDDPLRRPPKETYGTRAAFSDGFPLLVTNTASLDVLNDWLVSDGDDPISMDRFRANLIGRAHV